jgi:asparagine synthase (glutamine-hydrolysing)
MHQFSGRVSMCGITGFIDYAPRGLNSARATLARMTDAIAHRGPDGQGAWFDPHFRVCLGHRRLSIIDLSEAGAQPMTSQTGRYTITYNGEIYGFLALRAELEKRGVIFRGHSDTEILLAAVEAYGFENALPRLNGMFAFALYDSSSRQLFFARDRLGKKPLYIGISGNAVAFGSELKSLRAHPAFSAPEIDLGALTLFLRHNYIPGPYSIYRNIFKLPPGSWTALSVDRPPASAAAALERIRTYWSAFDIVERGSAKRIDDEEEALNLLETTLHSAVRERMVSDVPVGAFLSGGIDSSLISAVMQKLSPVPIKTYTIRFTEEKYDEADNALQVARQLKTDHTELTATPQMALDRIARLPEIYDEPFADPSQIPTILVSELARENVTVALSGDGGDESFAGYNRYPQMLLFERWSRRTPALALQALQTMPIWLLDAALKISRRSMPPAFCEEATSDRIKKLAEILRCKDFDTRYLAFLSQWKSPAQIVLGGHEPQTMMTSGRIPSALGEIDRMMYLDTVAYLPDDILVKVDRASMAVGLEMRAPLLDHRFVEAAWRVPRSLCLAGGVGKIALRRLLTRYLPEKLFSRPKHGFSVPINDWLRGSLHSWAADMLSPARLHRDGIFRPDAIAARWNEHLSGNRNWGPQLWTILMFNTWLHRQGGCL